MNEHNGSGENSQSSITNLVLSIEASIRLCESDSLNPVGLRRILIGPGALDELPAEVSHFRKSGRIVLFQDASPMKRGDADLKALVASLLAPLGELDVVVLGNADGSLHADEETLATARVAAAGAGCLVTVGSGTLTDVGKDAAFTNIGLPLIAVQSAASVNGFADDMAVVLKDGVKRTTASVWPSSLIIDSEVLTSSPLVLTQSGFGEMMATYTAPVDWRLAALVGADNRYDQSVVDLFHPDGAQLLASAGKIGDGDADAIEFLSKVLTTSGIAMGVAGLTAPCSGTEHVVSHLIDMSANSLNLPVGLHGAQVGVASLIAACVWERIFENLDPSVFRADASFADASGRKGDVLRAFSTLDSSGKAALECWNQYESKANAWNNNRQQIELLADTWESAVVELKALTCSPQVMAEALAAAGAPTRFSDLTPAVSAERARWAVSSCHLMRNRFNVVDLACFTGNWTADDVDAVLARAAELGGGL